MRSENVDIVLTAPSVVLKAVRQKDTQSFGRYLNARNSPVSIHEATTGNRYTDPPDRTSRGSLLVSPDFRAISLSDARIDPNRRNQRKMEERRRAVRPHKQELLPAVFSLSQIPTQKNHEHCNPRHLHVDRHCRNTWCEYESHSRNVHWCSDNTIRTWSRHCKLRLRLSPNKPPKKPPEPRKNEKGRRSATLLICPSRSRPLTKTPHSLTTRTRTEHTQPEWDEYFTGNEIRPDLPVPPFSLPSAASQHKAVTTPLDTPICSRRSQSSSFAEFQLSRLLVHRREDDRCLTAGRRHEPAFPGSNGLLPSSSPKSYFGRSNGQSALSKKSAIGRRRWQFE